MMNFDDPKYKGMLSMMPREVIIEYAEELEDTIEKLVVDGRGPECVPSLVWKRVGDDVDY